MAFNGGKMMHIFEIKDNLYTPQFYSPEAKEALENGHVYIKIDGSNALLKNTDGVWSLYSRYDDTRGRFTDLEESKLPEDIITLPDGKNISTYDSGSKHHSYFYKLRKRPLDTDKGKLAKLNRTLYKIIDGEEMQDFLSASGTVWLTVELVGKKFNATPGVREMCGIAPHKSQTVSIQNQDRTYQGMKELLLSSTVEGYVIEWKGVFWKIRSNCFDKNCTFEVAKKTREWRADMKPRVIFLP
jgi:hypothetical protein